MVFCELLTLLHRTHTVWDYFGRYYRNRGVGRTILITLTFSGALFIPLPLLFKTPLLTSLLFLIIGFFFSSYIVLYSTYLQHMTDKEMLGRTASNLYTFRGVTSALGTLIIAFFITTIGLVDTFILSGLVISTFCTLIFVLFPLL